MVWISKSIIHPKRHHHIWYHFLTIIIVSGSLFNYSKRNQLHMLHSLIWSWWSYGLHFTFSIRDDSRIIHNFLNPHREGWGPSTHDVRFVTCATLYNSLCHAIGYHFSTVHHWVLCAIQTYRHDIFNMEIIYQTDINFEDRAPLCRDTWLEYCDVHIANVQQCSANQNGRLI